jgi:proteasome lid subunit RPN8/RPN11
MIGFYHSHPDSEPRPSETDREFAWPSYSYVIQAVHRGISLTVKSWVLKDDRSGYDEQQIIERG